MIGNPNRGAPHLGAAFERVQLAPTGDNWQNGFHAFSMRNLSSREVKQ
jgi:hypothetical protein